MNVEFSLTRSTVVFRRAWRDRLSPLTRHILSNLAVGLAIAIVLWSLHGTRSLRGVEDAGIDWVMRMQWGAPAKKPGAPFALLDIDEATYRHWGEPFHTPRDRLLGLIDHAVQGGAALIVVDIDLSQRGHDPAADAKLQDYLAHYDAPGRPPLILSRAFREPLDSETTPCRSERRSFLEEDPRVAQSPLIHWGSPLFALDRDRVLRRWRLWEPVQANGQTDIVPSIQLLAVALLQSRETASGQIAQALQQALAPLARGRCDPIQPSVALPGDHNASVVRIAGLTLSGQPDRMAQRILYTQPWRLQPGQARPSIPGSSGIAMVSLSIRSALPIGDRAVDPSWLAGRVVMIGASFAESRDRHLTPLGEMPGTLVLINATQSLYRHGELTAPPLYVKLLVEAVLIVVMSLAFARFSSFWGMMASGLFIIAALLPISFFLFRYGVWLDFAIPLLGVQLHKIAADFEATHHHQATNRSPPAALEANSSPAPAGSLDSNPATVAGRPATIPAPPSETPGEHHGEARYEPSTGMDPDAVGADDAPAGSRGGLD